MGQACSVFVYYIRCSIEGKLQGDRYERAEVKDQRLSSTNSGHRRGYVSKSRTADNIDRQDARDEEQDPLSPEEDASYLFYTSAICSLFVVSGEK